MTVAVCVRCGARKFGAFTGCKSCDFFPWTEQDLIYSLAFTDHHFPISELNRIGRAIKAGQTLGLPKEQEDALRPAVQEQMRTFGPVLVVAWEKERAERKGATRSRIAAALKAGGIKVAPPNNDVQFCTNAAAQIALALMERKRITQESSTAEATVVGGLMAVIAAEHLTERLGCSLEAVVGGLVPAIVASWLPPGLPATVLDEMRARAAPTTDQVMRTYRESPQIVRKVAQVLAGWLAEPTGDGLRQLASFFEQILQSARVVPTEGGKKIKSSGAGRSATVSTTSTAPVLDLADENAKRMIKSARIRGYVTLDQLNAVLPQQEFTPEEIEDTPSTLSDMGMTVVEREEDIPRSPNVQKRVERPAPATERATAEREMSGRELLEEGAKRRRREEFMRLFPGAKIVTTHTIFDAHKRIPFSEYELKILREFFELSQRKGRDLQVGFYGLPYRQGDLKDLMEDGILPVHSPLQLEQGFLFLKCDAGRSFFGRQKAVYPCFSGGEDNEWFVGPVFKRFELAITSIGNVYRGEGLR